MSIRVRMLEKLYRQGKVTVEGLSKAVADGVMTQEQMDAIVGTGTEE